MAENLNINPNEDPVYRKKIYKFLTDNFDDFKVSEQDFYKKLDTDQAYAPKVYKVIKDNFSDFDRGEQDFMFLMTPSKKKDQAVSGQPSVVSGSTSPSESQFQLPAVDPSKEPEDNLYDLNQAVTKEAENVYSQSQAKIQSLSKDYEDYVAQLNQQLKEGVIDNFTAKGLLGHKKRRVDGEIEVVNAAYQQAIEQLNDNTKEERKKILNPKNRKTSVEVGVTSSEGENATLLNEIYDLTKELDGLEDGSKDKERISQALKQKKTQLSGRLGIPEEGLEPAIAGQIYSNTIGKAPNPQEIREYEVGIKDAPVNTSTTQQRRKSGQLLYENLYDYYQKNPKAASNVFSQTFMDLPDETGARKPSQYDFEMVDFMIKNGKEAVRDEQGVLYVPEGAKDVDVKTLQSQYVRNLKGLSQQTTENFIKLTPSSDDRDKLESGAMSQEAFDKKYNYENITKNLQKQLDLVNQYVLDDKDKSQISKYVKDSYTYIADVTGRFGGKEYREKNPLYAGLNDYQKIYLESLRISDPETYENRLRLLTTPLELVKQETGTWNPELQMGYEKMMKDAEDDGIKFSALDYLSRIENLASKDKRGELDAEGKLELTELIAQYDELQKFKNSQIDRYPVAAKQEIIDNIGRATGDTELGIGGQFVYGTGSVISSAVNWFYELITYPFSDEDSRISNLETIGNEALYKSKMNRGWEDESAVEGAYQYAVDPEFKKQVDAIDADAKLNQQQKYDAKVVAFEKYRKDKGESPIVVTKNPNAGDVNLSATAILNTTSDVAQQILGQIALSAATGGMGNVSKIRSLATLFGTTFATTIDRYEAEALLEGRTNATSYAIRKATIDALTELYGDDLMQVKNLFKGKGAVGKIINSVTEAEWKAVLSARKGIFNKVKNVIVQLPKRVLKPAATETLEEGTAQLLNQAFDGKDLFEGMKETLVTTAVGTGGAFLIGLPFSFRSINNSQKVKLYNAGANADKYIASVKSQLESGQIDAKEAQKRELVINDIKVIVDNMAKVDENGKPLSDQNLIDLAFNKYVELQAQKAKKENPKSTKLDQVIDELQDENAQILSGEAQVVVFPEEEVEAGEVAPEVPKAETIIPADKEQIKKISQEAFDKIERKDLFDGVGQFSSELGGSDKAAVPVSHKKINEIEFVEYAHPETGSVDVIVTGTSDNDFVGFYRIYENGKPTNKWSSKFENQSRNKEAFKTMISGVQEMLPEGHEYTEKTSISTDGLRVWEQQLSKGYELQYDENGKLITNRVAINGDALVNELGIPVKKGQFENINVTNNEDFQKVKKALLPYLEKFGLDESNIKHLTGTVKIDLPVLKKSKTGEVAPEVPQALKDVESTARALEGKDITTIIPPKEINALNKQLYNNLLAKQKELLQSGVRDFENNPEYRSIKEQISLSEDIISNNTKAISEAYHKAKADGSNPELVKAVEDLLAGEVAPEVPASEKVEQLRAEEQAEYAAMADPKDKAKRKEIYDRYDKLITPLLEKEKAESKAAPVPSIIEVKSPKEVKQGDTVVWRGEDFTVSEVNSKGGFNLQNNKDRTWTVKDARITDEEFQGKRGEAVPEAKPKVPAKTTSDVVADDLLNFLGIKPDGGEVKFSKTTGQPEVIKPVDEKEKEVIDRMNSMNLVNEGVELGAPSTTSEKIDVDELNSRLDTPLEKINWDDYEGIPFAFTISDQLRSGDVTNPATGEVIKDLKGGIGFNGTAGNEGNAWANTSKDEADALKSKALDVYNANKPLFEKLWADGKLPDGHIPVAVVKMAESAILSNEAVFRVGIQNIETLPERNRQKAVVVLNKTIKQKSTQLSKDIKRGTDAKTGAPYSENTLKAKKKLLSQYNKILDVINKYGYKDIVEVLKDGKHFSLPEKAIIASEVFYGAPTPIGGKPIDIARSRPSTPVSVALIGNKNPELINIGRITDLLTEPSMKNVPNMHVVSIVGIDVKNPQTTETNHPNYKYGVKGQSIGILESPVHMKDAFGEAYGSAISQVTKNEASNASINAKQAMTQGIPVQAGLPNRVLKGAIARKNLDAIDKLTGFLRQAFPSTTFFTSQEAWDAAMADPSIKKKLKEGEVVYAFTTDGNVFINPSLKTTKAALHETGHIWMEFVRESNPELYEKGLSLVDGTKEFEKAKQQYGDTRLAREEALMELMSSKGDTIVNASQKAKFKEWLLSIYKYISESFTSLLGLSPKEIENLTLDKFLEGMLADILSGKEVTSKKVKTKLKLSAESTNDRIKKFIDLQREKGVSDKDIKAGIEKVAKSVGLSKSDINNLMAGEFPTKPQEYAVQEQAAGEVPVQPKAGVGEEVEGGVPPTRPEEITKEGEVEGEEGEVKIKPSGIKKGLVSQEVLAKMNLEKVGDKELLESGRKIIDSGEVNPPSLVNKILDEGKGVLTPAEVVALITYKADLDNKQEALAKEIAKREESGKDLGTLLADMKTLQTEIDNFDMAAVITAQQQSMSFRLRRYMLDRSYNITVQIEKYKRANNGVIPAEIEKKFREMDAKIKELNKKLTEAEAQKYEQEGKAAMENIVEDVQREQKNGPALYTEAELEEKIQKGVQAEIEKIYTAMPTPKRSAAQRAITALENIQKKLRSKTYDASLGIPVAVIDAGITAIKNAIKLGIEVEKAVEIGIKTIKDKLKGKQWAKENDFRKDMIDGFKAEGVSLKAKKTEPKINDDGTVTIPNQLIRDLVAKGITDIDDLADAVRKIVEPQLPGVTNRQIRDYITGYGKQVNPTRDDITTKMNTAKRVGRLLSQLEDLQKMGAAAYMLKYRTQKPSGNKLTQKEQELKKLIKQLEKDAIGEDEALGKIQEQKDLDTAKARIRRRIDELSGKIARKDFSPKAKKQVPADQELRDLQSEKEKVKEQFDNAQYEAEQKNKSLGRKINDALNELLVGLARTLVTGFDFGVVFTQGVKKVFTNPIMSAKAFAEGMKQFASESRQKKFENDLRASGAYELIKNSGLAVSVGEERASVQEQIFIANYVNLLWNGLATIVTFNHKPSKEFVKALNPFKASQRFMDAYLNYIRINTFLDISSSISKDGYPPEVDPELHKSAAEWVNTTTMKGAKNIPRGLGFLMFSASKVASELKLFSPYVFVYYYQMPGPIRKRALLNFGKFALSFLAVTSLMRAALGDDDDDEFWDITSSNFLTFKFGDQRVSFAGGMRPMLVFWGRFFSGRYVDQYGEVSKLGERPGKDVNTKGDLVVRFFTSKFAPVPSAVWSKLEERAGREVEDDVLINKLIIPMWLQDSGELYENNPREIGALYTMLSLIGANVRTIETPFKKEQKVSKNITYTDEYSRKRKIELNDEQLKEYQRLFDEIYAKNIEDIKQSFSYKNKKGQEKLVFEAAFSKKAKTDAESDAQKLLEKIYKNEFKKFDIIRETPEEKEVNRILNRGEKKP